MRSMSEIKPITTKSLDCHELPWVPFAPYSDEVLLKYHHISPVHGEILATMRFPPGQRLPTHCHTGIVIGHTLTGAWRYLGHDWVSRAWDTACETAGSSHTPGQQRRGGSRRVLRDRRRAVVPR